MRFAQHRKRSQQEHGPELPNWDYVMSPCQVPEDVDRAWFDCSSAAEHFLVSKGILKTQRPEVRLGQVSEFVPEGSTRGPHQSVQERVTRRFLRRATEAHLQFVKGRLSPTLEAKLFRDHPDLRGMAWHEIENAARVALLLANTLAQERLLLEGKEVW